MPETVFQELKRYVRFCDEDERALRALHAAAAPRFEAIAEAFGDEEVTVPIRSALKCEADAGVCRSCYGIALATGA